MEQRYLVGQGQRRVLGLQAPTTIYRGERPPEQGTPVVTPTPAPAAPAQQFVGTLNIRELNELRPWLRAVTLGSTGDTDLGVGYLAADVLKIHDDDDSHELSIVWNESEASGHRTLNILVHGGNRTLDLYESLTIGDGYDGTITFPAASKVLSIDESASISEFVRKPDFVHALFLGGM